MAIANLPNTGRKLRGTAPRFLHCRRTRLGQQWREFTEKSYIEMQIIFPQREPSESMWEGAAAILLRHGGQDCKQELKESLN